MKQPLNFDWLFIPSFKDDYLSKLSKEAYKVDIPHNIKDVPYNYFNEVDYQKVVTYEKTFDVNEDIKDKAILIHFEGFMLKADI